MSDSKERTFLFCVECGKQSKILSLLQFSVFRRYMANHEPAPEGHPLFGWIMDVEFNSGYAFCPEHVQLLPVYVISHQIYDYVQDMMRKALNEGGVRVVDAEKGIVDFIQPFFISLEEDDEQSSSPDT